MTLNKLTTVYNRYNQLKRISIMPFSNDLINKERFSHSVYAFRTSLIFQAEQELQNEYDVYLMTRMDLFYSNRLYIKNLIIPNTVFSVPGYFDRRFEIFNRDDDLCYFGDYNSMISFTTAFSRVNEHFAFTPNDIIFKNVIPVIDKTMRSILSKDECFSVIKYVNGDGVCEIPSFYKYKVFKSLMNVGIKFILLPQQYINIRTVRYSDIKTS